MNNNIKLNKVHVFKSLNHYKINSWINKHNVKVLQLLNLEDNRVMILYEELGKPVKENVITRDKLLYEYNNEDKKIKSQYREKQIDLKEKNMQLRLNKINYYKRLITEVSEEIGENKVLFYMNKLKQLEENKNV